MNKQARKEYLRNHRNLTTWENQLLRECGNNIALRKLELDRIKINIDEMLAYEKLEDKDDRAYQIMISISHKQFIIYDRLTTEIESALRKLKVIQSILSRELDTWFDVIEKEM